MFVGLACSPAYGQVAAQQGSNDKGKDFAVVDGETVVPDADDPEAAGTEDLYSGNIALYGIATTNNQVPYWMRTNQYGAIPLEGLSSSLRAGFSRKYNPAKKVVDWGFGLDGRLNVSDNANFQLVEAYIKGKLSIFQLKAGRDRMITGIADSSLTLGSFTFSGNAPGLPGIELSVPEYWALPLTRGVLSFKGNFMHAWVGQYLISTQASKGAYVNTYVHQKSLYGRLGKDKWKVKLYGGFNHQVMWGGEKKINGRLYDLSDVQSFLYVAAGKTYGKPGIPRSKLGNHIGSLDQALEVDLGKVNILAYHQFFYEVGGLYHLNNVKDGLFGLRFINKKKQDAAFGWRKVVVEIWNSTSQGGEADAKPTPSGDEDYYNNYIYEVGWSYMGENLGNNLITTRKYARSGLPSRGYQSFINNRVAALHLGAEGYYHTWQAKILLTASRNYGNWASSPVGGSGGGVHYPGPPPYFEEVFQFSGYVEASRPIGNRFNLGFALALDQGKLLYNSFGGQFRLSRSF